MALNLTTKERVKALHRSIAGTTLDGVIDQLIAVVSRQIERWLDCEFLKTARTEVKDVIVEQSLFVLRAFPVAPLPTAFTVKNAFDSDFTLVTEIAATDYNVDRDRGILKFRGPVYTLVDGPGTLQISYTGGLADTTANLLLNNDFIDLVMACEQQVLHDLMRTPNFGSPQRTVGGGGQSFEDKDKTPFIPVVYEMLEQFRRG